MLLYAEALKRLEEDGVKDAIVSQDMRDAGERLTPRCCAAVRNMMAKPIHERHTPYDEPDVKSKAMPDWTTDEIRRYKDV